MSELEWLDEYSGQSTEELISLESKFRTDSLSVAFEQALDQKMDRVGREKMTKEELVVLAVEALEREVNNGGYDQFFNNSSNEFASIIVDALNRIESPKVAKITQDAIGALGISGPITVKAIEQALEDEDDERDDKLSECDDQYYDEAGDLSEPLMTFIKENKNKIILKG